jgi:small subunit ribosomal protein S13
MAQPTFKKNLQKTFGIGVEKVNQLFSYNGLNMRLHPINLKKDHTVLINNQLVESKTGKQLQQEIKEFIEFAVKNQSYKGIRHKLRYPVRGQRTHTNAKTKKKLYLS